MLIEKNGAVRGYYSLLAGGVLACSGMGEPIKPCCPCQSALQPLKVLLQPIFGYQILLSLAALAGSTWLPFVQPILLLFTRFEILMEYVTEMGACWLGLCLLE